ncbi:MAG: TlpA disulfide reductase family protein [Capnocytophaga sp.]|nr:TlpA disulfide reductase family protein [Capnocytophaga sp.]
MKKPLLILLFLTIYVHSFAQVTFSERVEYSELATPKDKPLFFIDFWATWCVPCVHVSTYLNTIQEQFRDELYIVSLTQERSDVVRPFLEKHPTKLAVSIDYEGQTFKKHSVRALPHGVLLNADGEVLWKGNPANITPRMIRGFLAKNKKTIPIYDFLKYTSYQSEEETNISLNGNFEIKEVNIPASSFPVVERFDAITMVKGSLSQIVSYLLKVSQKQVALKEDYTQYELLIRKEFNNPQQEKQIVQSILSDLGYKLKSEKKASQILEVWLPQDDSGFWNAEQINWGERNAKFLVDDNQFSADNISVSDFLYKLSDILDKPIVIKNDYQAPNKLYDWQIHYKFADLMYSNLSDLGIQTSEISGTYPKYLIEKL